MKTIKQVPKEKTMIHTTELQKQIKDPDNISTEILPMWRRAKRKTIVTEHKMMHWLELVKENPEKGAQKMNLFKAKIIGIDCKVSQENESPGGT